MKEKKRNKISATSALRQNIERMDEVVIDAGFGGKGVEVGRAKP